MLTFMTPFQPVSGEGAQRPGGWPLLPRIPGRLEGVQKTPGGLIYDHASVSYGGNDNPGTVPTNIIPLCCTGHDNCNSSKSNKNPVTWLNDRLGQEAAARKLAEIKTYFEYVKTLNNKEWNKCPTTRRSL